MNSVRPALEQPAPLPVLYFSNALVRGGAEEHILTLLRGLDRDRFHPHLVCTPEVAEQLRPDVPPDVEVIPLTLRQPRHWGAALSLARILRKRRVAILHSHLFYSSLFASPVGWLCRVPVILETPHLREQWRHGWLKGHFFVDRLVGRLVTSYIAVSGANGRYLVEEKGLPARKVIVIQNGCDLGRFTRAGRPPAGLREGLGFGADDPVLLVAARLEPQKGHRVLFDAMPEILRHFPRARLICAGAGALRETLEAQARTLGVDATIRFVGQQSDIAPWYALADLTVLPSLWEGLPLVAIESLAAERTVVATAVDGTPEVVVHGHTGLTVPAGDGRALANAICRLLRDPAERLRLARAGRQLVEERFSEARQVHETAELYLRAWFAARPAAGVTAARRPTGSSRARRR